MNSLLHPQEVPEHTSLSLGYIQCLVNYRTLVVGSPRQSGKSTFILGELESGDVVFSVNTQMAKILDRKLKEERPHIKCIVTGIHNPRLHLQSGPMFAYTGKFWFDDAPITLDALEEIDHAMTYRMGTRDPNDVTLIKMYTPHVEKL